MSSTGGQVEISIRNKLHKHLEAVHLEIINESHLHGAPYGTESHFKVVIVSRKFEDLSSIKRHQLINNALRDEFRNTLRALAIVAKTPDQWAISQSVETSPKRRRSLGVSYSDLTDTEIARWS